MSDGYILAVDIATTSAFAVSRPGERPTWGHQRFGARSAENGEVGALFETWLDDLIVGWRPELLVFESPYVPPELRGDTWRSAKAAQPRRTPMNITTLRRLFGLAQLAETVAYRRSVECREVDTASVASHFLGKGSGRLKRAEKKAAFLKMCQLQGFSPVTEDEADALGVLCYAEWLRSPQQRALQPSGGLFDGVVGVH